MAIRLDVFRHIHSSTRHEWRFMRVTLSLHIGKQKLDIAGEHNLEVLRTIKGPMAKKGHSRRRIAQALTKERNYVPLNSHPITPDFTQCINGRYRKTAPYQNCGL